MNISIYKIRPDAKLPHRAHVADAGMDLFYCTDPGATNSCVWENGDFRIPPGENCLIPTGIKIEVPEGYMLEIKNKSGVASKRQLLVGACVVDPGYTGEIFVNLHNIGKCTQEISHGQKIAQAVLVPIITCGIQQIYTDPADKKTSRGTGGFGSTGEF